jgi:anthranilate/para-aminobenzoate synthase component II
MTWFALLINLSARTQADLLFFALFTRTQCQTLLENIDCIILSPGPGSPSIPSDILYGLELVQTTNKPVLGICLGCQAIGVGWGGEMAFTPNIRHGQVISVQHDGKGVFDGIPLKREDEAVAGARRNTEGKGQVDVVVYNSLTLDEKSETFLEVPHDHAEADSHLNTASSPGMSNHRRMVTRSSVRKRSRVDEINTRRIASNEAAMGSAVPSRSAILFFSSPNLIPVS